MYGLYVTVYRPHFTVHRPYFTVHRPQRETRWRLRRPDFIVSRPAARLEDSTSGTVPHTVADETTVYTPGMNLHDLPPDVSVLRRLEDFRKNLGAAAIHGFFQGLSRLGRMHPLADPARHGVEVLRDIPYLPSGNPRHRLDIYRPTDPPGVPRSSRPVVVYLHGGGFRILSKDTHWLMGLAYARRGYLVLNCSYRLAPRDPFPAALEDAAAVLAWLKANATSHGGDLQRVVFAGESAGANLATALAIATCYRRDETFARAAWDTEIVPRAVIAACGILQVSDPDRFGRRKPIAWWVQDRIREVSEAYLRGVPPEARALADPLATLESAGQPDRPLPGFFLPVGTRDVLLDDTRRLHAALMALGVRAEARYYPGEVHAFHAFVWRRAARACWRDTFAFLTDTLAREDPATPGLTPAPE